MSAWEGLMSLEGVLDTIRSVGIADVFDVAIVTVLLYSVLLWFKQTKAAFVARGIFIFAMVYFVARQAKMYLTTWVFQGFFAVFLIALVVIFQEELRSFFERLAAWGLRRRPRRPFQPREMEILIGAVSRFAHEKIGALIVLKGRDPLERYLEGGYEMDGILSEALLGSIFDPHSDGHDGAVILEGNRLSRFAVYLPLSKEFHKLSGTGTRHAAALGISEKADALCIVVSEEKGTISIARDGEIRPIQDIRVLQQQIASFIRERMPSPLKETGIGFLRRNMLEKIVSVVFAVTLWMVFAQDFKPVHRAFRAPIEVHNLPSSLQVESIRPSGIRVSLSGLRRDFGMLDPDNLKIHIDLDGVEAAVQRFIVSEDNLPIPRTLRLVNATPASIDIQVGQRSRFFQKKAQ